MSDYLLIFIVFTLIAVIWIQAIDRFFYSQHMMDEQSKLIKAIMSKDVKEYTEAVKTELNVVDPPLEDDEIPLSQATDEEFDKLIKQQTQ